MDSLGHRKERARRPHPDLSPDRNYSEQHPNLARSVIVDRPPRPASGTKPISHVHLNDLMLGDPGLDLLKNGLTLEQIRASSINITRKGHEVGQLQ
jgi:hypothetical protein